MNLACLSIRLAHNVSICVRAGLSKQRPVPDNERIKDTKTLDYASTPLDANTLLAVVGLVSRVDCFSFTLSINLLRISVHTKRKCFIRINALSKTNHIVNSTCDCKVVLT